MCWPVSFTHKKKIEHARALAQHQKRFSHMKYAYAKELYAKRANDDDDAREQTRSFTDPKLATNMREHKNAYFFFDKE